MFKTANMRAHYIQWCMFIIYHGLNIWICTAAYRWWRFRTTAPTTRSSSWSSRSPPQCRAGNIQCGGELDCLFSAHRGISIISRYTMSSKTPRYLVKTCQCPPQLWNCHQKTTTLHRQTIHHKIWGEKAANTIPVDKPACLKITTNIELLVRTRPSKLCESQIFGLWVYLKNVHPWKIFTLDKYSPLEKTHFWKIVTPEKYWPLKNIQP